MMVKLMSFITGNVYPSPTDLVVPIISSISPGDCPPCPNGGKMNTGCDSPTQNNANFWPSPCRHTQLRISILPRIHPIGCFSFPSLLDFHPHVSVGVGR